MLPLRRQRSLLDGARPPTRTKAPESRAGRVKEAAETASAIAKALLFFGAIGIVAAVIATTLWRDRHARHVEVSIDGEAERALRAMGSQIDLRQTFVDVLNARISGVEQIFSLNFTQLIDTHDAPDVSFKPFGLDASSGEITKIVRQLTGAEPPIAVRIELSCPKAKCEETGAAGSTLLVTVVDAKGSERLAIPIGGAPGGLPRRLRDAMRRSAELLLERAEPLIAAVYFFNSGQQHAFLDDRSRDLQRAVTSALKLRDNNGNANCIANIVIGGVLFQQGSWEDGLVVEQRAGLAGNEVCDVHAATNVVSFLFIPAVCNAAPADRQFALRIATQAFDLIGHRSRAGLAEIVADRIPTAASRLEEMKFLNGPGMDAARRSLCQQVRIVTGSPPDDVEKHVIGMLDHAQQVLPARPGQRAIQVAIDDAAEMERFALPNDAIASRYRVGIATMRVIERYLPTDPTPRRLFALRGVVATELAATAADALALDPAGQRALLVALKTDLSAPDADPTAIIRQTARARLVEARADFKNALSAESSPQIGEKTIDVALATADGDASLTVGDLQAAREGYSRAIDTFLASEVPTDQVAPLADAVTRLVALDRQAGACRGAARSSTATGSPAARLGISPAAWCAIGTRGGAPRAGLLATVDALVRPALVACGAITPPSREEPDATFRWLRCVRTNGPGNARVAFDILNNQSGTAMRAAIENALRGSASAGN